MYFRNIQIAQFGLTHGLLCFCFPGGIVGELIERKLRLCQARVCDR